MFEITPIIESDQEVYERSLWEREECYRYYVEQRRMNCSFMELMDLWLLVPYCSYCAQSNHVMWNQQPDISAGYWTDDMRRHLDRGTVNAIKSTGGIVCKRCESEIAWNSEDVHIVHYHLEEHYGIPLETPGKINANKKLKEQVFKLYDQRCFGCDERSPTHIDHVRPRSLDGDVAFRNLQPLCDPCGQTKGAAAPGEVGVFSDVYFMPPPSDAYPGLFW